MNNIKMFIIGEMEVGPYLILVSGPKAVNGQNLELLRAKSHNSLNLCSLLAD